MAAKKEYTLKINGVKESIKDITTLDDTLKMLDATLEKTRGTTIKTEQTSKSKTKALTEEEKASKKLADTIKKIEEADTEANRKQILATKELRERTREVSRNVAINELAEGSIAKMGMTLTNLRNEYEALGVAQRNDEQIGGALLEQIQTLDAEYKALRESTGNFRDSVGNYEKALSGLNDLTDKFDLAARGSTNLAASVAGSNDILDAFGSTTETVAKSSEQLAGIVALATIAQEAYTKVTEEGIIAQKSAEVIDGIRAIQLRAKTAAEALATKGTIGATIAQAAFNLVASANPYVLIALALAGVVSVLGAFILNTDKASESQQKLSDIQALYLEQLDAEAEKLRTTGENRIRLAENNLKLLEASGAKTEVIRKAEDKLAKERLANNAKQRGFYAQEISDLDRNRAKLEAFRLVLLKLNEAKAKGEDKIKIDVDLNGKIDNVKVEDAINAVQSTVNNLGKTVQIAVDLTTEKEQLKAEAEQLRAQRRQADIQAAKDAKEKRETEAKERKTAEISAQRATEDARLKLIENSYEQARATVKATYKRQIEDLKTQLLTEKNLTVKARGEIKEGIKLAKKNESKELEALDKERAKSELETLRQLEDSKTALIQGEYERRKAEINISYDRQIQDLQTRLSTEKSLTDKQQKALSELIVNAQKSRNNDLQKLETEGDKARADNALTALDNTLASARAKIGDLQKRDKTGLKLIDVEGTKANIKAVNSALDQYIESIKLYQLALTVAHNETLASLKENTPEYEAEVQKYASAQIAATQKIKDAEKERTENTKVSTGAQIDYYKELFGKIGEVAQKVTDTLNAGFEAWNMGLQVSIDDLKTQLETVSKQYDVAQQKREELVKNVQDVEARLQQATGGTAIALREQLADSIAARNEASREEQRLAKEKEKREAEIQRKEKAIKRNNLISGIAQAVASTAQAVAQALASAVFPFNLILAGIVGAAGTAQVAIMTNQLTKLRQGGLIVGKSHEQGGVPIGNGYEAEGGEFVVNKKSYAENSDLINFINASQRKITGQDLTGVVPQNNAPIIVMTPATPNNQDVIEAIKGIDIKPVVSVVDILDVQNNLVTVQDLAGK